MFIADYLTRDPKTVLDSDPVSKAQEILRERNCHQLPVIDDAKRLIGIVSDRDIRSAMGYDRTLGDELRVAEVMTASPTTIRLDAPLDEALEMLCQNRFNALPVMENSTLVGIITRQDILKAFHVLLGLDAPGRRVEIALPNIREDLHAAFGALRTFDGDVVGAVVSNTRRDGDEPTLYLRVAGTQSRPAEHLLRHAGLIVLVPEHQ